MSVWQKDKDVTDRFGVDFPSEWLDGEPLTSVVITIPEESGVTQSDPFTVGESHTLLLSGGSVGFYKLIVRGSTPTRQFEQYITLWVRD